jgi:Nucleotidyl transferase AbiEii toxin, Type IV TA system
MKEMKNLPASIRTKLLVLAKANSEDFNRTLVRYGIERFLYRLSQHAHGERFILKGAMLFITWPEGMHRPTGDLDLLGYGPPEPKVVQSIIAEICVVPSPEDGLVFDPASVAVEAVREEDKYQGFRVTMLATLEKAKIPLQIDVGFGDAIHPAPRKITFPCLLAGMHKPEVLAYPPETVIAEKFEAMVRFGAADGRLKDFNDIWAISKTFDFEMATLAQALIGTFARRETALPTDIPFALTAEFAALDHKRKMWNAFLKRNPPAVPPPPFEDLLAVLRSFLGPVLTAAALPENARGRWRPARGWSNEP